MTDDTRLSRRQLLAGGSLGVATLAGGITHLSSRSIRYDQRTLAAGDVSLRVDWAEFYNGERVERQTTPTPLADVGPVITLEDVLPGDSGMAAFGLRVASGQQQAAAVEFRFRLLGDTENGRTEPEVLAGDDTPADGELADRTRVRLWYDGGFQIGDEAVYGRCDGRFDDLVESQRFEGTLAAVTSDQWRPLDAAPGGSGRCLSPGDGLCLALAWELPNEAPGGNRLQGDGAQFELAFRGSACAGGGQ